MANNPYIFKNLYIHIIPAGLGKKRLTLFQTQISKHGGTHVEKLPAKLVTHIIVEDSLIKDSDRCLKLLQVVDLNKVKVIGTQWFSKCLQEGICVNTEDFEMPFPDKMKEPNISSSKSEESSKCNVERKEEKSPKFIKYSCTQSSYKSGAICNSMVISELQKLADAFRSSGDQWRTYGYEKAISAIRNYGSEIKSFEVGRLRKVEEICGNEKNQAVELFTKVWGAGPATAQSWYQQVKKAALAIEPRLKVELCGSYRRGKVTCGDIDVMITRPEGICKDILAQLLEPLKESGFISDDLVNIEVNKTHKKYLGLCRLPGENQKHRRLDIFVVPHAEYATALMHYTGSAMFNRSIRLLASHKGMSLSEHSLLGGVVREGKDILNDGYVVPTPTEESIFKHLELEYKSPTERDH
ncbi:hypothetical protein C0J52_08251 [Blattella germanica]|nr:hypothetical protein C0J52_08251 [Blattella germanica]